MLNLKFTVTLAIWGHLKIAKITILSWYFPSKLISKCCNLSMNWDWAKGFSAALVTRYLNVDLRKFLASHMSKLFLEMRGSAALFKRPSRRGHIPLLHPLMYIIDRGRHRKCDHLF
jgi:hypothetical protein